MLRQCLITFSLLLVFTAPAYAAASGTGAGGASAGSAGTAAGTAAGTSAGSATGNTGASSTGSMGAASGLPESNGGAALGSSSGLPGAGNPANVQNSNSPTAVPTDSANGVPNNNGTYYANPSANPNGVQPAVNGLGQNAFGNSLPCGAGQGAPCTTTNVPSNQPGTTPNNPTGNACTVPGTVANPANTQ